MGISETEGAPLAPGVGLTAVTTSRSGTELEELFKQHERPLGKYLVQMVRDRELAEDLLQDVFHQALRDSRGLAEARSPVAWLFGVARNQALSALRRRRRFWHAFERLASRTSETSTNDEELAALNDLLERSLTPDDRALVLLRYLHGFSAVELAEMTGSTPAAVRQRLARARASLLASEQPSQLDRRERD